MMKTEFDMTRMNPSLTSPIVTRRTMKMIPVRYSSIFSRTHCRLGSNRTPETKAILGCMFNWSVSDAED